MGGAGGPRPARPAQGGSRPPDSRGPRREGGRPDQQRRNGPPDRNQRPPQQEERPAKVTITFQPEQHALEKVTEQLKSAPIAYPLFGVAKMFLQRPERHHVIIKPQPETKLFKLAGTAHFATERGRLETIAFQEMWKQFFRVEVTEAPEIKGNFASVARSRLTGKVFGPTSHHSYQPAIHKEYEERFSRRMSFAEYKSNIETTNNPEAIELWKTESRRMETYHLLTVEERQALSAPKKEDEPQPSTESYITPEEPSEGAGVSEATMVNTTELSVHTSETPVVAEEPDAEAPAESLPVPDPETAATSESPATQTEPGVTFTSRSEAENYFRKEILPTLITEVESETLTGQEARALNDRRLTTSVRLAWEAEMRYPLGLVNAIRVKFNEQNLHIFKFKKRVLLISSLKPSYLDDRSESLSRSIRTVLQTIHATPGIDRKGLAEKILGSNVGATEDEKLSLKHSLIGDLYWLVRQGHVIEFSDGTFDLPMGPKAIQAEAASEAKAATEAKAPKQSNRSENTASSPEAETSQSAPEASEESAPEVRETSSPEELSGQAHEQEAPAPDEIPNEAPEQVTSNPETSAPDDSAPAGSPEAQEQ
jgi:hypothetical protein